MVGNFSLLSCSNFERVLVGSTLTWLGSCANPENTLKDPQGFTEEKKKEKEKEKMKQILHKMISINQISTSQWNIVCQEFSQSVYLCVIPDLQII